uniref:Uncharacterized protein n=1 Tax=Anopheles triannulatus TaxID=58253 RepID=A0A2M4AYF6_9DIPT
MRVLTLEMLILLEEVAPVATFSKIATTTIVVVIARVAVVVVMPEVAVTKVDEMVDSLVISSKRLVVAVLVLVLEVVEEMEECLVTALGVETTTNAVASSSTKSVSSRAVSSIEMKLVATVTTRAVTIATVTTIAATGITIVLAEIGAITTAAMTVAVEGKIGVAVTMDRVAVVTVLASTIVATTIGVVTIKPTVRFVGMMTMKTGMKQELTSNREPRLLETLAGKFLSVGTNARGDNRAMRRNRTNVKSRMMIEYVKMVHPVVVVVAAMA